VHKIENKTKLFKSAIKKYFISFHLLKVVVERFFSAHKRVESFLNTKRKNELGKNLSALKKDSDEITIYFSILLLVFAFLYALLVLVKRSPQCISDQVTKTLHHTKPFAVDFLKYRFRFFLPRLLFSATNTYTTAKLHSKLECWLQIGFCLFLCKLLRLDFA
jgi:hypothetical protein